MDVILLHIIDYRHSYIYERLSFRTIFYICISIILGSNGDKIKVVGVPNFALHYMRKICDGFGIKNSSKNYPFPAYNV